MRFTQDNLVIPLTSGVVSITADVELETFSMKGYDHAMVVLHFNGELSDANNATAELTVECGTASSGDSADLTFNYRKNSASDTGASSDVLGVWASASTLEIASGDAGRMLILEWDANELPTPSKTYDWCTVDINFTSCSVGAINAAYAILSNPRYAKNIMPAAVA